MYYLCFWLSICRTSLAVSAPVKTISPADAEVILRLQGIFVLEIFGQYRTILECGTASVAKMLDKTSVLSAFGLATVSARRYRLWNSVLWNAVFCTVSERSRPFPTERYIMCNERITCSVGRDTLIPPRRNLVGLCCACKTSVKLHKTNDLLFPRLFPNTIPKRPQFAAQCQIIPVGIYDQICLVQAELAAFVQQALVHIHGNDFSQKQVVAA